MPTNTYVALQTTTVTTATPTVTFSAIPSGYTDLFIAINGAASSGSTNSITVQYNGDTTSGLYSHTRLLGDGSSASSARQSNANWAGAGDTGSDRAVVLINIQNYSNTTTNKTHISRSNSQNFVSTYVGLWRNTAAITSVTLGINTLQWAVGTTFSLYGIAAAGVSPAAKATGGTIYSDDTYYYHVFGSTGTFTPLSSLTADVLVVAGGGGGGAWRGGGGGAGGLLSFTSQSLTATGYTCTVGAGGAGGNNTVGSVGGDSQFGALTLVKGGGYGSYGGVLSTAGNGGSGGGGVGYSGDRSGGTATSGQGNAGGTGKDGAPNYGAGGGGGAGAVGANGTTTVGGNGGVGVSTYSSYGLATGTGENVSGTYYYAGGGGGASYQGGTPGTGGLGGGTAGTNSNTSATSAQASTGGGGGGGGYQSASANGGSGGSGVVIIRYAK